MKLLSFPAFVLALLTLTACPGGDTHEKAAAESLTVMQDFTEVLAGVTDEASARAAKPELEKISKRMNEIQERMTKLGEPTAEQQQELEKMKGFEETMKKFMAEAMRVGMDPALGPILEDAMKDMNPPGH